MVVHENDVEGALLLPGHDALLAVGGDDDLATAGSGQHLLADDLIDLVVLDQQHPQATQQLTLRRCTFVRACGRQPYFLFVYSSAVAVCAACACREPLA